jgi:enediyne biosynthesis protein E7
LSATATTRSIPGPKGKPVIGSLPEFRKSMVQALMDGWRDYGDVVRYRGPISLISIAHPDHVQYILRDNAANYHHADFEIKKLQPTFRNGLVTSQGEFWARQRKMMQPTFHRERVDSFVSMMADTTAETLEQWQHLQDGNRLVDMRIEMQRLTLRILTNAVFSSDWADEAEKIIEAVTIANEYTNKRLLSPVDPPEWAPLPSVKEFNRVRQMVDDLVYGLIADRRQSQPKDDILSLLLDARDDEGRGMSDLELHDELISLIFAGHETVSVCLTWTWYHLSKDPSCAQKVRDEVDELLGDRAPTREEVRQMQYIWQVLQEALRMYPPIWVIPRTPLQEDVIDGYRLEPGAMLFISPYVVHRHSSFYDNPESFDPERIAPENTSSWHRYQYIPFGGGPRKCIGHEFAMLEMTIIVAMVTQRFRLDLLPGHPVYPKPMVTLRPAHGMPMIISPRGAKAQTSKRAQDIVAAPSETSGTT